MTSISDRDICPDARFQGVIYDSLVVGRFTIFSPIENQQIHSSCKIFLWIALNSKIETIYRVMICEFDKGIYLVAIIGLLGISRNDISIDLIYLLSCFTYCHNSCFLNDYLISPIYGL